MSSAERSLALSISMIESNGLGCKGVNPVANLDVLKKPSEPHFTNSPGIDFSATCWRSCRADKVAVKECLAAAAEAFARRLDADETTILETLRIVVRKTIRWGTKSENKRENSRLVCFDKNRWFEFTLYWRRLSNRWWVLVLRKQNDVYWRKQNALEKAQEKINSKVTKDRRQFIFLGLR